MPTDDYENFFSAEPSPPYYPPVGDPPPRLNGQLNDPGYIDSQVAEAQAGVSTTPEVVSVVKEKLKATPIDWDAMLRVPPREWVYGHFLIKRFVSVLGAPGGSGKTAYAFTVALSVLTGSSLIGETVHEPGNVWIYNLEDPLDELLRRVRAAVQHHGIERTEVDGRLYLDSGRDKPLVIAKLSDRGDVVLEPLVDEIIEELKARDIRLLIVDPFVKSHRLEENVNEQIDRATTEWSRVADKANCSVLLVHHFRKGGVSGDAAAFRGASALIDAVRAALSLTQMSEDEAKRFGIDVDARWQYLRVDNAKLNLAPPPETAIWLKLVSEDIGNGDAARQSDHIQAIQRWEPPSPWEGMPMSVVIRILDKIDAGPEPGEFYALGPQSKDRWAGHVVMAEASRTDGQAKTLLKAWKDSGVLEEGQYASHKLRGRVTGYVRANQAKVQEMRQQISSGAWQDE